MFKSLYSKLAAVLAGLFCFMGLFFIAAAVFSNRLYQQEVNQRLNRNLAEQILAEKPLIRDSQVNKEALKEIFHALMVVNPGIEVYLLDADGNIMAFSAPEGKIKRKVVDVEPINAWLSGDENFPVFGDDPRDLNVKKVFSVARIPKQGTVEGYLYVILGGELYDSVADTLRGSHILGLTAWMVFAGLLFSLVTGLILFRVFTSRLGRLSEAVRTFMTDGELNSSNFTEHLKAMPSDEIGRLSEAFVEMAKRIDQQLKKLSESDASRRELIANVSHDLRTPLATLRSYIETLILKEDRISESERRAYLETAVNHCKRLSRLISELMELAKYESSQIKLNPESFNLAELLSDVTQKFRLEAAEIGIEMEIKVEERLAFAVADIAMIERVLENLLENAIHHTPSGGKIVIELANEKKSVSVRIINTGKGIPPEDLPLIFERYYRSNKNRSADSFHSGLGLAICRKILQLHNREIRVDSLPNRETTFAFSLYCDRNVNFSFQNRE